MIKKVWLLLLSLFVIFWFWVSFANPIAPDDYRIPSVCSKLKNVEIDNYNVILAPRNIDSRAGTGAYNEAILEAMQPEILVPKANECIEKFSENPLFSEGRVEYKVLLVDKTVKIGNIREEIRNNNVIYLWSLRSSDCIINHFSDYDCDIIETYNVVRNWDDYELKLSKTRDLREMEDLPRYLLLAVIMESLVLFFIAKIFREKEKISNKKLIMLWIIPTTITLPLLWFVLPWILWNWVIYIIIWEILVAIVEAIMIKYWLNISRKKSIIASIMCNVFSFLIISVGSFISISMDGIMMNYEIIPISWILLYVFVKFVALAIMARIFASSGEISRKRIILVNLFAPILSAILVIFLSFFLEKIIESTVLWISITILLYVVIEILMIKYCLKISRKKSILAVIFSDLFLVSVCFLYAMIING